MDPPTGGAEGDDSFEVADHAWVPREWAMAVDTDCNAVNKLSLRGNQLVGNDTKCCVVLKRAGERYVMYVDKEDKDIYLKFSIIGGTDNPAFELSLKAGNVRQPQLAETITIAPKDGCLTAQFHVLPTTNRELKEQTTRAAVGSGPFTFTPSLQDVIWRQATLADLEDSGLPEDAVDMFEKNPVTVVTFKTSDPKTFYFERSEYIKTTTTREFAHRLLDTFRLIDPHAPLPTLTSLSGVPNQEPVNFVEVQVFMRRLVPIEKAWQQVLASPLGLPANWRYCRHDLSTRATLTSMTVHFDREMDGQRAPKWCQTNDKSEPSHNAVPVNTKTSFAHVREYESHVTAGFLKDERAASDIMKQFFSRKWPACLTPVQAIVPEADTSVVLALFNIQRPVVDDDKRIPFPNPGEQISLRFPESMSREAGKTPYEEIWPGTLIPLPVNVDAFNMAALVRRPDSSRITVLSSMSTNDIHFEFGQIRNPDVLEYLLASLLHGPSVPKGDPQFVRTLLGRNNWQEPELTPLRVNMTSEQESSFNALVNEVTSCNNPSQKQAVDYALDHFLTLIRGPPGTGKSLIIQELIELLANAGMKVLVLAPSNSATENNAENCATRWNERGYNAKEHHWVRKTMDERMMVESGATRSMYSQPPGRVHILGIKDAPSDVAKFFRQEIVDNALGHAHELSLKARIMLQLEDAAAKAASWTSTHPSLYFRALEDREFLILTCLAALMHCEKTGLYELHASTKHAIESLGFNLSPKKPWSRSQTISNHQKAFRFVWRLAEHHYASYASTVVHSTVGNAILSPAFEGAEFDAIIIDEATNIAESEIVAAVSRFHCKLIKLILVGDPAQLPPVVKAQLLSELSNMVALSLFQRLELTGIRTHMLNVQYRMEPGVAKIIHTSGDYIGPDGKSLLVDHESTLNRPHRKQFISWSRECGLWGPDTDSTTLCLEADSSVLLTQKDGSSRGNHHNAVAVLQLVQSFLHFGIAAKDVMVIAMYKSQVLLINRLFYAHGINIKANTVDYSEGKENEFAIIDLTTPLRKGSEIGFLRDKRRINVALSRPKNGRVVLASRDMVKLPRQSTGAKMLQDYALQHRMHTACVNVGPQLLRNEGLLRPDKFAICESRRPAIAIYDDLRALRCP